jgi:RimJ/RimL family protein N-acetyltransferase
VALRLTDRAHLAAEIGWVLDPSAGGQGGEWTSTLVYGLLESDR